jgi:Family of unknown function (DUF6603)
VSDRDLLSELGRGVARLYDRMIDSVTSAEERAAMLTHLGIPVGDDDSPPDATAARQTIARLHAKASTDAQSTSELQELLELLVASSLVLRALFEDVSAGSDRTAATIFASYFELMCLITLRLRHPAGYAVMQAFRLLDDQEIYFERLPELLSQGGDILRGGQASSEEEDVELKTIPIGALAFSAFFIHEPPNQWFVRKALFGVDLDPETTHPHAQEILNRMVTLNFEVHTPEGAEGVESGGGIVITYVLVPPHHGGPGAFFSLGGEGEIVIPIVKDQLELKIEPKLLGGLNHFDGAVPVLSFTEIAGIGGAPDPTAGLEITLERPLEGVQSENPLRLGGKDATHVEMRGFKLAGQLGNRETGAALTLEKGALVIAKTSLGSLIGSVMPSEGLRLEASFTLGWNTERRLYLEGGAGLKATLPIERGIPGVKVHTVTIELAAKNDEPAGVDLLLYGSVTLGVRKYFEASFDRLGFRYGTRFPKDKSGPVMGNEMSLSGLAPTGIGISFDLLGLQGGGFLLFDAERGDYGGVLQCEVGAFGHTLAFKAFGLLTERPHDEWSFLLVISLEFDPALQLGQFFLHGVGGILAVNHTIDVTAMQAGLRTGALDKLLFPANPIGDAPAILQTLRTVFPPSDQRTLVGPMLKVGIGAPLEYLTASVALVVVMPAPYLIALLGSLRMALVHPDHAVVDLRADFFGVYDLGTGAVSVDASLVKSRIAWFPLEGDVAYRSGKDWFLSAGGFHPHFAPPAAAPQLRRLKLDVSASARVKLRFEAYFALTSNTMQFGAQGELSISVGSFGVYGFLGFDALINDSPTKYSVHVALTLELRFHGSVLAALHADVLVEGPGPMHVKGRVSMSILFWDISVPFDETWAAFQAEIAAADYDVIHRVHESMSEQAAWGSVPPPEAQSLVTFRNVQRSVLAVHPLGRLTIQQAIVPLGVTVARVGTARPKGGPTAVHVGPVTLTSGITATQAEVAGLFARAQYFDLTDDERLSAPSYEPLQSGVELASETVRAGAARRTDVEYETVLVGAEAPRRPARLDVSHLRWAVTSGAVGRSGIHDARVNAGPDQSVRLTPARSVLVDTATMQPATDVLPAATTLAAAEQTLAALAAADPARAQRLQVVGAHEVAA